MLSPFSVCIEFSGLTFRFIFPNPILLPEDFTALLCDDCNSPDEEFEICLLTKPLQPASAPLAVGNEMEIHPTSDGILRIYSPLIAKDGCQVACLLRHNRKNVLYYPASRWEYYSSPLHCMHLIAGEALLLRNNAFLLHSSVVLCNGQAVLFSGPSGAGKSTQAALWAEHLGADIINGDRCVIMRRNGIFYGGGSPWCGSSAIRRKEQAPIAGIFILHKALRNSVQRLGFAAFKPLLTQTTVNGWDTEFMSEITQMTADLIDRVPIYGLNCLPDADAARLGYRTLFEKEILP